MASNAHFRVGSLVLWCSANFPARGIVTSTSPAATWIWWDGGACEKDYPTAYVMGWIDDEMLKVEVY